MNAVRNKQIVICTEWLAKPMSYRQKEMMVALLRLWKPVGVDQLRGRAQRREHLAPEHTVQERETDFLRQ